MFGRQVVLVTGCSSGIGRSTAIEASRRGHFVFASARRIEDLVSIEGLERARPLALDVADPEACPRAVASIVAERGRLDAVVNNAGYAQYGAVEDVSLPDWRRQYEVNVIGAVSLIQAALPAMRRARHGAIVNVSSVAGKISIPFAAPYCSSKHALEAISDALRVEVAPFGIRVVVVEPGPIATRFDDRARQELSPLLTRVGPYSGFYPNAQRAMDTDFQMGRLPAEAVAKVIIDAIESERPRTRYRVTSMSKILIPLRRVMPDRFFDWRMRKALRLPKASPHVPPPVGRSS